MNFGGIGVVIGHEMTHGFDDQGSKFGPTGNVKYNADGSLGSWFTPEDQAKFDERTKCVSDEYGGFEAAPGQMQNGKLTLGENAADNGGIRIAFRALQETLAKQGCTDLDGKQRCEGRVYGGAAVLHQFRTGVVREPDGGGGAGSGEDGSA